MKLVRITGGPAPKDIRIVDAETGTDLTSRVLAFEVKSRANGENVMVGLTVFAELDLVGEVEGA